MPTEVAKWALKYFLARKCHHPLLLIHRNGSILNEGIEQIGRHTLVGVPVAGLVLEARKEKLLHGGVLLYKDGQKPLGNENLLFERLERPFLPNFCTDKALIFLRIA